MRRRGAIRIGLSYRYTLAPGKTLADFNMEAQEDLLANYYVLRFLGSPAGMRQPQPASSLALFEAVLGGFLADPASRLGLPSSPWRALGSHRQ
ncbi:hypothetical protein [Massilia glaciei]|uniref:Uncharacterized protein n=1 Tax=Massilia glaciei TaxID=1524097 RepID=A0A2U2I4U5_9BURK|nr:hypothetical protein [Massilia glaciei]PWF54781.1 hypothetical protein C7C56_005270 [Massilia glaciei]